MEAEHAIIKIWSLHIFHQLTDYFGPIIYSEQGNGERVVNYDPQDEIYMDFFNVLEEGVNVLERYRGQSVFGTNDIIFGGAAANGSRMETQSGCDLQSGSPTQPPRGRKPRPEAPMPNMMMIIDNETGPG